jgi:diguanylate cyclase (GGDEF)-like protein
MDDMLQTIRAELPPPEHGLRRDALLVHIYPTGPEIGTRYVLKDQPLVIGRGETCDVRINDGSVSRRHASVHPEDGGYAVTDLGSTNGTWVNNVAVEEAPLQDGDYLRVGNRIYRFFMGGSVEAEYHEEIYKLAIMDALTQTHNKRYLLEFLDRELARSERHRRPLALLLFDLDHFKAVNDERGHLAGDDALRELAGCVKASIRREELFARYGGEEFAVVLPETTEQIALVIAERIRARVEAHPFAYDGERYSLTVSLGVAVTPGGEARTTQEMIRAADQALYRAKSDGRNCVRAWPRDGLKEAP